MRKDLETWEIMKTNKMELRFLTLHFFIVSLVRKVLIKYRGFYSFIGWESIN